VNLLANGGHLFGIADGMGGYALGNLASSLALDIFFDTFYDSDGANQFQKLNLEFRMQI